MNISRICDLRALTPASAVGGSDITTAALLHDSMIHSFFFVTRHRIESGMLGHGMIEATAPLGSGLSVGNSSARQLVRMLG